MRKVRVAAAAAACTLAAAMLATSPASAAAACTAQLGGNGCGAYTWPGWPGSNGFNTYVEAQNVGATSGSTGSVTVTSPSSWTATANYGDCGGCVQSYDSVQQLTNNWGTGGFNGSSDLPLSALKKLQVAYSETGAPGDQYEFSPDIWTDYAGQQGPGTGDIMMWADTTSQRCVDNGLNASNIIGHANLSGQNWTVYSFGPGEEIIMVLDGGTSTDPVDDGANGSCAQQTSGTLHVLEALKWLSSHHVAMMPSFASNHLGNFDAGYEITVGNGGQYAVTGLTFPMTIK